MATAQHKFGSEGTMTVEEVCEVLKIDRTKLYKRLSDRDFIARKDKKRWLIDRRSFQEYLDNLPENGEP